MAAQPSIVSLATPSNPPLAPAAEPRSRPAERSAHSAFVPVMLSALALMGWLASQVYWLAEERQALRNGLAAQQQTVDNAGKLRNSLDGLAADTQRLADAGNASAALLVAELRKRGVTINAAKPAAEAATTPR
jgi:hypothetical protein